MSGPSLAGHKNGDPTLYSWGLKSIHQSYNMDTCFLIIASNEANNSS